MDVPNEICVALDADHVHMTKFDDPINEVYQLVVRQIREVSEPEPMRFAEAVNAGSFKRHDDLILTSLGLIKVDERLTVDPKGMQRRSRTG